MLSREPRLLDVFATCYDFTVRHTNAPCGAMWRGRTEWDHKKREQGRALVDAGAMKKESVGCGFLTSLQIAASNHQINSMRTGPLVSVSV